MLKARSYLVPIEGFKKTMARFPVSSFCALVLFFLTILHIHDVIELDFHDINPFSRLVSLAFIGYFLFGVLKLFAEGHHQNKPRQLVINTIGFALLSLVILFLPSPKLLIFISFFMPALLLLIGSAAYIKQGDNLSVWFFNKTTWFGIKISILAGLIWGLGISAALASIGFLFEVEVNSKIYGDVWAFALIIFAPLYALSWVPERFSFSQEDCHSPPQLSFILNWALAPLVIIYLLILYAYFIKILLQGSLPEGLLSYLIIGFGSIGVLTYLAGWPIRDNGHLFLKLIYKLFFPALIIPTILMAIALNIRIAEYGITEMRYLGILVVLWFSFATLYYSYAQFFNRQARLSWLSASLAFLLIIGSIGPWGAYSVTTYSQMDRLEKLLIKHDILRDGKIIKTSSNIPFEDRKNITSLVSFMQDRVDNREFRNWLNISEQEQDLPTTRQILEEMNVNYTGRYMRAFQDNKNKFSLYSDRKWNKNIQDTRGFDYRLELDHKLYEKDQRGKPFNSVIWPADPSINFPEVNIRRDEDMIKVRVGDDKLPPLDLTSFVLSHTQSDNTVKNLKMIMDTENENYHLRLIIRSIRGEKKGSQVDIDRFSYNALLDRKN